MKTRHDKLNGVCAGLLLFGFALAQSASLAYGATVDNDHLPPDVDPAETVFGVGEKLVFSIGLGLVNAGDATLEVVGLTQYQGRTCYQLQSKANSNRFFSSFYKVRDKITSYMDVEVLRSRYFQKRLREGDYKKTVEISFDHEAELAKYSDGNQVEIVAGIQDVLSAFYFVRNLDLDVGDTYSLVAHSSRKTYDLKVIVYGKEQITVGAGTFVSPSRGGLGEVGETIDRIAGSAAAIISRSSWRQSTANSREARSR